jgi:AraC-like DNA-binding protein
MKRIPLAMDIIIHMPPPPLNVYIKCMWYASGVSHLSRFKMLPMPSLHLMVNLGDSFQVYAPNQSHPFATCSESWFIGLWNSYHFMDTPRTVDVLNVTFKPGGAYPFLSLPLAELHNEFVSLDAIWGRFAGEVRERLYDCLTIASRFALMERLLLARLCDVPAGLSSVQYAVAEIAQRHGALSIRSLSDDTSISQKHLITLFRRMVGTTPKELARLYRFHHALRVIDLAQPVDWTRVAHECLYYDQSHFNRDFEAFTGHNPGDYLQLRRRIPIEDPEQPQPIGRLPAG